MRAPRLLPVATVFKSRVSVTAESGEGGTSASRLGSGVRALLIGAGLLILSACASLGGDERASGASDDSGSGNNFALRSALSTEDVDAMLVEPLPEPRTVDEFLDQWSEPAEEPREQDIWARLRSGFAFPDAEHERIAAELQRFNARQPYFDMIAARGEPYLHLILERVEARDLPSELVLVAMVESAFQPFAYSHGRAGGIWQFQPATATRFGLRQDWWYDGRRNVRASTEAALDYLEYLHGFFDGDWMLALAAYNAGEGRVQRAVRANERAGQPTDFWYLNLPAETRNYVPRILALRDVFAEPDAYGITLREIPNEPAVDVVEADSQIDLAVAADLAGISIEKLYRLNPAFNRWATHPDGPHELLVPIDKADALRAGLDDRDDSELVQWKRHEIGSGETLAGIARQYGVSVGLLREVNDLPGDRIRAGRHLLVPTASRPESDYALSAENRQAAIQSRSRPGRQRVDYRVESGDTLWDIARSHDVTVRELASWNNMAPGDMLRQGQSLAVWVEGGAGGIDGIEDYQQLVNYRVRPGDSLSRIASRFNVGVDQIRNWNGLDNGGYLQPGQQLELHVDVRDQSGAR